MEEIVKTILSAKRKRLLRSRPIFSRHSTVSEEQLFRLATGLNFKFTLGLSKWLLLAGYGDIDESLSFREDWFSVLEGESLKGHVSFAHDVSGNHYSFNQNEGGIYIISPSKQFVMRISEDFPCFLQELIRRDYYLKEWINSISIAK